MHYRGTLYRALNPIYAREPLSGGGAAMYGGRFNPKGTPALYASLGVLTALRETNQVGDLQPTILVSYRAEIDRVFDGRDESALDSEGMTTAMLADNSWRDQMRQVGEAPTQAFARRQIDAGYQALLVRSFAPGASAVDMNLVIWRWDDAPPSRITVVDDENRLSP
jgi:RES domain-containing protein